MSRDFRSITHKMAVGMLTLVTLPTAARDWDQWQGPDRNLISTETGWQADWTTKKPTRLWATNVGKGYSALSISEGRAYTVGNKGGQETVYCFDAELGKKIWSHSYRCGLVANLHSGGSAATPTIDADRVYTLSREGHLYCFRKSDGKILWNLNLTKELSLEVPDWGFSSSPLVDGEKLILDAGPLVAFDKNSGDQIWKTRNYNAGYGSPALFEDGKNRYVTILNNDALLLARIADGKVTAEFPWKTQYRTSSTTPIVHAGTVFISTAYNRGCALLDVRGGKFTKRYENKSMRNHMNNSVLFEGFLYGFDRTATPRRRAHLICVEHETGRVRWKQSGFGSGGITLVDKKLIVLGDEGELVIARANPEKFVALSRQQVLRGTCWTMPVLSGGRIYCRNELGDIVCLDVRN